MFRKVAVLKFLGKYGWWRLLLSRCAAYSLERYWRPTPSQIFSCEVFEISDNSNLTRWTTVVRCLLSYHIHSAPISHIYINTKMLFILITQDALHCQSSFQQLVFLKLFLFLFPSTQFLSTRKHFKLQPWFDYFNNLHFFDISPSFRIKSLGTSITASYLNQLSII